MSDALSDALRTRFGGQVDVPEYLEQNPVLRQLAEQTSHRRFTEQPVDRNVLDTLLKCALSAPAKSDLQQVAVIRVAARAKRDAIAALIPSMPWVGSAPEFLLFAGDNRRIRQICDRAGKPYANDHLDSLFNATVDAALVMMNFVVAVQGAGLGCCPVSAVRIHARAISDLLELPPWVFPVAGMAVGHPVFGARITPRLSSEATVHTDSYDDTKFAASIDEYDQRRHVQMPLDATRQRLNDKYDDVEFFGWSEDKARQVSVPEREHFGAYIKEQKFNLT